MAKDFFIEVHKRELGNKNFRKNMRGQKQIPGIYYSHDSKESIPLYILESDLNTAKKTGSQIFTITVGNKERNILFKSVQYHPVTDKIIHLDLYGIKMDQVVSVNVTLKLRGEATGVSQEGGILVQGLNELEIDCLPKDIPEFIEVDVSELAIGDNIRAGEITIDNKLTLKTDENQTLVSVTHAMKEEEPVVELEDEDDEFMSEEGEEGEEGTEGTSEDQAKEDSTDGSKKEDKTK